MAVLAVRGRTRACVGVVLDYEFGGACERVEAVAEEDSGDAPVERVLPQLRVCEYKRVDMVDGFSHARYVVRHFGTGPL